MTHQTKHNRVVRWITLSVLVALALSLLLSFPSASAQTDGCMPVGDRPADVEVCDVTLDDGTVTFDLEADGTQTVYVALADARQTEGSVSTVERSVTGNESVSFPAPSDSSVRWSVATLDGFAFGEVGTAVSLPSSPTWLEFNAGVAGVLVGTLLNVFVAVFIILRGRETHITQLW